MNALLSRAALIGVAMVAGVGPAFAADAKIDPADTAFMIAATALVLLMTLPGLALFYGGMVRSKNILVTMAQSVAATAVVSCYGPPPPIRSPSTATARGSAVSAALFSRGSVSTPSVRSPRPSPRCCSWPMR
jgi:hypothetical protein